MAIQRKAFAGVAGVALVATGMAAGMASLIYHELDPARAVAAGGRARPGIELRPGPQDLSMTAAQTVPSSSHDFRFAANVAGEAVPASLGAPAVESQGLSDPGSRYIFDSRTGRVIGIDGSASAAANTIPAPLSPPLPDADATPIPIARAIPVEQPSVPVRRALPVTVADAWAEPHFPGVTVRRALPVLPEGTGVVSTRRTRVYTLPDGEQFIQRELADMDSGR